MRGQIKVRSCKQYMFYGTHHMVLEKFEVHFSIHWPFNNCQCHNSIHSKKCGCQKMSSTDKVLFHCGVASFFGTPICLSGSLIIIWCLVKEANLFRLILADMSNVVIPSLLISLWGNVLELVFAGPVCWTEKKTEIELNPTAKDQTTSCSCTNSEFFWLPVARFVEKSKNRKKPV